MTLFDMARAIKTPPPVENAIDSLRRRGIAVSPTDIPGLWLVAGRLDMTDRQLIDAAAHPERIRR